MPISHWQVQITSWFDDPRDTALLDLIPYFEQLAAAPSVPPFLVSVKPPQRATVPVSVMLASPTSMSLQPVSQLQLQQQQNQHQQNQQQQSFSPITSVDCAATVAGGGTDLGHHPQQPSPLQPITGLYIRDINPYSPFSRSLKSLSSAASKSLPSIFSVEYLLTALRNSRSETNVTSADSAAAASPHIGRCRRRMRKSLSDLPVRSGGDRLVVSSSLWHHHVASRSVPSLPMKHDDSRSARVAVDGKDHPSSPPQSSSSSSSSCPPPDSPPQPPAPLPSQRPQHRFCLPRSASFSFQTLPTDDRNPRSSSFSNNRTGLRNSVIAD